MFVAVVEYFAVAVEFVLAIDFEIVFAGPELGAVEFAVAAIIKTKFNIINLRATERRKKTHKKKLFVFLQTFSLIEIELNMRIIKMLLNATYRLLFEGTNNTCCGQWKR